MPLGGAGRNRCPIAERLPEYFGSAGSADEIAPIIGPADFRKTCPLPASSTPNTSKILLHIGGKPLQFQTFLLDSNMCPMSLSVDIITSRRLSFSVELAVKPSLFRRRAVSTESDIGHVCDE